MDKGYSYTLVFMVIVSLILTTILAVGNSAFLPKINENRVLAEQEALLDAFGVETDDPETFFKDNVVERNFGPLSGYELQGESPAYALPFEGAGLWGTIYGYLAVDSNLEHILGITFTDQNETPGLGGRIDEEEFRDQFRGVELKPLSYGSELQAITGATQTSGSVLRIINNFYEEVLPRLEVK